MPHLDAIVASAERMLADARVGSGKVADISQLADGRLELRLDPPELGSVIVEISVGDDNVVKAVVTAQTPEGVHFMRHAAEALLRDGGSGAPEMKFEFREGRTGDGARGEARHKSPIEWEVATSAAPPSRREGAGAATCCRRTGT